MSIAEPSPEERINQNPVPLRCEGRGKAYGIAEMPEYVTGQGAHGDAAKKLLPNGPKMQMDHCTQLGLGQF